MAAKAGADELFRERIVGQRLLQVQAVNEALGNRVGVLVLKRALALGQLSARTLAQLFALLSDFFQTRAELVFGERRGSDGDDGREARARAKNTGNQQRIGEGFDNVGHVFALRT